MKKSFFWYLTLCALLIIASVNGWSVWYRIAIGANALVVLLDVVRKIRALSKGHEGAI